jgi:hypothetical protein
VLREDLDLVRARVARALDPGADAPQVDQAVAIASVASVALDYLSQGLALAARFSHREREARILQVSRR